jgi:hypothetical protein
MIRVVLADDQVLVRAGFGALLAAEDDIEVAGEAADGRRQRNPIPATLPETNGQERTRESGTSDDHASECGGRPVDHRAFGRTGESPAQG